MSVIIPNLNLVSFCHFLVPSICYCVAYFYPSLHPAARFFSSFCHLSVNLTYYPLGRANVYSFRHLSIRSSLDSSIHPFIQLINLITYYHPFIRPFQCLYTHPHIHTVYAFLCIHYVHCSIPDCINLINSPFLYPFILSSIISIHLSIHPSFLSIHSFVHPFIYP